jgi:hypothetical protein
MISQFERLSIRAQKLEERAAKEEARKDRLAELNRLSQNAEARRRRAEEKAAALREQELSKLIGALGMLGSEHAGERAAAALQVERLRAKLGKTWRELISA